MTKNCNKECKHCNCTCTKLEKHEKCSECRYCTFNDDHIKKAK